MPAGSDGGKWALAGFLYQMLGVASITARTVNPLGVDCSDEWDEVGALVASTCVGPEIHALHEHLGQDAVFTADDDYVIAQFKYSATSRRITTGELREIIRKLDESASHATSLGDNVTACELVTNRDFTDGRAGATELWATERRSERPYHLRRRLVLRQQFEKDLRDFGGAYGLFPREIERGMDSLIGRVLRETVQPLGASIGRDELVESFTGHAEARPLTLPDVVSGCHRELETFRLPPGTARRDDRPIEREVFGDIVDAINERALVGIYGGGGCGKSVILWQLLKQLLDQEKGFCVVSTARSLSDSWVTNTVHDWRNLPLHRRPTEDPEMAIQRLQLANPGVSRHILWLGLDGLDERVTPGQISCLHRLLDWFWNKDGECRRSGDQPSATLVITCRCRDDLQRRWLDLAPDSGEHPCVMEVGDFSVRERREAARASFPELYHRLASVEDDASISEYAFYSSAVSGDTAPYSQGGTLDERVLQSLRHPVMWRALLGLGEADRLRAVHGEREAVRLLAQKFVGFLHWKLMLREPTFQHVQERLFVQVLRSVAVHTTERTVHSRADGWARPACATGLLTEREGLVLYDEALSAGLIAEESDGLWRWRHGIVHEYLVTIQ